MNNNNNNNNNNRPFHGVETPKKTRKNKTNEGRRAR